MFHRLKIKWKLIILIMVTTVLSLVLVSSAFTTYRIREIRATMLDQHRTRATILAKELVYALAYNDRDDARTILRDLQWWPDIEFGGIYDTQGNVFADFRAPGLSTAFQPPKPDLRGHYFSRTHLVYFHPVYFQNQRIGSICLQSNLRGMHTIISETLIVGMLAMVFASLLAFILANYFQRVISKPIRDITEAAREVANRKDYLLRLPDRSDDELGQLTEEFNLMLRKIQARDRALVEAKERLEINSRELAEHRDHLEKLVEERTAHLRSAYDEIRAFVFMFSHDLRTPLVNIKGFTGELRYSLEHLHSQIKNHLETLPDEIERDIEILLTREVPESLGFLEQAASSMDRLINAMLKLSFLGRRELTYQQLEPRHLIQAILDDYRPQLEEHQVDVRIGKLPRILADADAVKQIFQHIIENAIAYLDPNRDARIEIWGEQGEEVVFLYVRDNGRGIEAEDIPRVFEPFRRLGEQKDQGRSGQGMGLVYARTLIHRHGGKIWCTSKPGVGTTFSFTIAHQPGAETYTPLGT